MSQDLALREDAIVPQALPGRVILKFDKPKERVGSIFIPETTVQIKNIATVVSVGYPVTDEDRIFCKMIKEGDRVNATEHRGEKMLVLSHIDQATGLERFDEYRVFRMYEVWGLLPRSNA